MNPITMNVYDTIKICFDIKYQTQKKSKMNQVDCKASAALRQKPLL